MALDRFRPHKKSPDFVYISLAAILVLFGLVMISSSSVVQSTQIYDQNYAFVMRQLIALGLGGVAAIILSRIPYERWRKWAPPFFMFCLFLLLLLFIPGIGKETKGAVRWINLGLFQLQPSELLKLGSIIYFSAWFERRQHLMKQFGTMISYGMILLPIVGLMIVQRDLGTLLVILLTLGLLYFAAGASYKHIALGIGVGIALVAMLIAVEPYRLKRLATFRDAGADTLGAGYHINQANLAIGSGGWWGRGFGKSLQKYLYLPEPQTDSIFAITVEELGFVRSLVVLLLIGVFAYRGFQIASRAPDQFSRLLVFGLTTMLLVQAIINISAILGLIPLTGVPLPFISYGGTSLISCLIAVGIVANISRYRYVA